MSKQNKVLIIYGSTTGLTEMSSMEVEKGIREGGIGDITHKNVLDTEISDLDIFEYIVLGCSTWDYGCLQYDFEPFNDAMKEYDFKGKKVAIFGTGDKSYGDSYCEAIRILGKTVTDNGAEKFVRDLDIECDLTEERIEMIKAWGKELATIIQNSNS